jgi:AcrR family transcriptional regulator
VAQVLESTNIANMGLQKPARRADRKEKLRYIRRAAYVCFSDKGYHQTSVDDICETAEISKGSFYWYFDSKQAVFLDIVDTWATEVEQELGQQFEEAVTSAEPFEHILGALRKEARRGRLILPIWLEFIAQVEREPAIQEGLARFHARIRRTISTLLAPLVEEKLGKAFVEPVGVCALGLFIGLMSQERADPTFQTFDSQASDLFALLKTLTGVPA